MLNLTDRTIPRNSGCYRPIELIIPPGTVVNVEHPGPSVGGNSEIHERIVDVLFGCLSAGAARAGGGRHRGQLLQLPVRRHPSAHRRVLCQLPHRGLRLGRQGDRRRQRQSSVRSTAIAATRRWKCSRPATRGSPTATAWWTTPAGHGRSRGGAGSRRVIEARAPEITVSSFMDRHETGRLGPVRRPAGTPGSAAHPQEWRRGLAHLQRGVRHRVAQQVRRHPGARHGDRIEIVSPGGGGYGPPAERDPEAGVRGGMRRRA